MINNQSINYPVVQLLLHSPEGVRGGLRGRGVIPGSKQRQYCTGGTPKGSICVYQGGEREHPTQCRL